MPRFPRKLRAPLLAALCVPILPLAAQEAGGLKLSFGIDQRFEAGRNLGLRIPDEGTSALATTRFSARLESETRTQRFVLDTGGLLRLGQSPNARTGFDDPRFNFSYRRDGANSGFTISADYRRSQIDFLRALQDFVNEEGELELPPDFDGLTGTGTRVNFGGSAQLVLGREGPLGLTLRASRRDLTYQGATSPSLFDTRRESYGASLRMQLAPTVTGTLNVDDDRYRAQNLANTDRRTMRLSYGVRYEVSPALRLDASLGATRVETTEFGVTTRAGGGTGQLGLELDVPDGRWTARLGSLRSVGGGSARLEAVVGRNRELPRGALDARLGLTRTGNGPVAVIGGLNWRHDLPTGRLSARIDRAVSTNILDEERIATVVALNYSQEINAVSGFGLGLSLSMTEGTATTNRVTRTDVTASYRHALTEDWGLNAGVAYRVRDEAGVGTATSPSAFISIGRRFNLRP